MTLEALATPLDIPWRRLAYSADMIDRDFDNPSLPPRWRSSLAVFGHAVPMVETEDRYPEARIVYLRLTISITGWSARLALQPRIRLDEEGHTWRPWIRRAWDVITSAGWAETNWELFETVTKHRHKAIFYSNGAPVRLEDIGVLDP
jgi:hypothetical protein